MQRHSAALVVALSSAAWATTTFPTVVEREYALGKPLGLSCGLCHQNNVTVASATITPFALAVKSRGAVANDETKLKAALALIRDEGVDSDGDGCTDVDELRGDTNPNIQDCGGHTGGGTGLLPAPRYGCGAESVPAVFGTWAALALLPLRRRRR